MNREARGEFAVLVSGLAAAAFSYSSGGLLASATIALSTALALSITRLTGSGEAGGLSAVVLGLAIYAAGARAGSIMVLGGVASLALGLPGAVMLAPAVAIAIFLAAVAWASSLHAEYVSWRAIYLWAVASASAASIVMAGRGRTSIAWQVAWAVRQLTPDPPALRRIGAAVLSAYPALMAVAAGGYPAAIMVGMATLLTWRRLGVETAALVSLAVGALAGFVGLVDYGVAVERINSLIKQ
ncbi:hypothetical protein APE_1322.1 [Aeropyrum pernix K1]|uniref:Uncharacterized protein n=1 Tax=Aeropyrum pernix (strain ATCC 700893 / DSM 11879 / JCM 9820 / NBRC 100138 / K1) TaxID=272557 RepID=Q9YCD5_AERPE|nr:hypothetical protein [Aeropyrum pernix]BAA80313.2 hypothetical protein APE_1322.1 [Aeropyrum pernix K1]